MPGLVTCNNFSEPYCIIKLTEVSLAGLVACLCLLELVTIWRHEGRISLNTKKAILLLMLLSLLCTCFAMLGNVLHQVLGHYKIVLYLQLFFASNFFLAIFYFVAANTLTSGKPRIALNIFVGAMVVVYLVILILREVYYSPQHKCSQTFYLTVDLLNIIISVCIFALYCRRSIEQRNRELFYHEKLVDLAVPQTVALNVPFTRMWVLIATNIFCGLVNLCQTALYYFRFSQTCEFSQDVNFNEGITFLFVFLDYYLGAMVTLGILHWNRVHASRMGNMPSVVVQYREDKYRTEGYTVDSGENKLEMVPSSESASTRKDSQPQFFK